MPQPSDSQLAGQTIDWLAHAQEAVHSSAASCHHMMLLAREGVHLRRCWDQTDRDACERRDILRILPAVQTIAQQRLAQCISSSPQANSELIELVCRQLDEDDHYLVELLTRPEIPLEAFAFAVECFRDDLHWMGTQVVTLEGQSGIDFLGRVLLEQESLVRDLEAWFEKGFGVRSRRSPGQNRKAATQQRSGSDGGDESVSVAEADELRQLAQRLRATALARQFAGLVDKPEPTDGSGWCRRWQAASHLAMRLDPQLAQAEPSETQRLQGESGLSPESLSKVDAIRRESSEGWIDAVSQMPFSDRQVALREVASELSDEANESLTFLEDLTLEDSVRDLKIVHDDLTICLGAARSHGGRALRPVRRTLRRCRYRVAGELQERRLAWRMEVCFGRRAVVALERFILLLLILFCVMLLVEGPLLRYEARYLGSTEVPAVHSILLPVFAWIDLGICFVFLTEFGVKMALARRRGLYLWRNWFTGLLPAIPVGFLGYATHHLQLADEGSRVVLVRFLRYLRLPRMARWLRIARPIMRLVRVLGFAIRASDRLVRRLAPLLNRNLLLFERGAISVREPVYRTRLGALRERFYHRAVERLKEAPLDIRYRLVKARIEDLAAMLSAPRMEHGPSDVAIKTTASREIPLERVIARLLAATPAGISDRIGRNLAQSVARWCSALDVFLVRRLPLVRDLVASKGLPSPYETTARVANHIGLALNRLLDHIYWLADLYGTVTAPQLVDSTGEYLVKGTARPARRLVMIGAALLAVSYLASWLPAPTLNNLAQILRRLFGWPLVVLGGICMVFFALGIWLRQIAGQASEFYNQVADAQFITITKKLKWRIAERYRELLDQRVVSPERKLDGETEPSSAQDTVELMWNDYLDGAPFHPSDTRTTNQLLGNLALVSLRDTRLGLSRRDRARLKRLDLVNNRLSLKGPYLWFHFISRSLGQQTAKLVIDYNAFALPLSRAQTAEDWEILRYVKWLAGRLKRPMESLELPEPFQTRLDHLPPVTTDSPHSKKARLFHGNEFTAVHFLTSDAKILADVRRRYGDQVADLTCSDRRDNIRRVFRTYPFHHWPKEQRILNPLHLYQRHLEGGRVLLLPFKLMWAFVVLVWRTLHQFWKFVRDVLEPQVEEVPVLEDFDPFAVAVRKIHRMRMPLFLECLRLRAACDPEFLGVTPPGFDAHGATSVTQFETDLQSIVAAPTLLTEYRDLAHLRRSQMLDFRRRIPELPVDNPSRAALRAMAIAYVMDYQRARSCLEATDSLQQAFDHAIADEAPVGFPLYALRALWCQWRIGAKMKRLFRQPAFCRYDEDQQVACRQLVCRNRGELLQAVRTLADTSNEDPAADAKKVLANVGSDPESWTRQLVVLRTVQTMSVIDLKIYCDMVAELGEYDTHVPEEVDERPICGDF